jgi:glycosyltransferase involved in cell wall biosynthesis
MKKRLRIAIFEPSREVIGGGQKAMARIAEHLSKKHDVTLFTQRPSKKEFELDFGKTKIEYLKPSQQYLAPLVFFFKKIRGFDLLFLGGFPGNLGSIRNSKDTPCMTLCYSPTRVYYDLREHLKKHSTFSGKLKLIIKSIFIKRIDFWASQRTHYFLAISENVRERIRKYYNRDSVVFYPGIDFHKFKRGKYENYILSVARFVSAKRVDMIIKSMGYVKNKKIKMVLVGAGEREEEYRKLSKEYPNIDFLGFVGNEKLFDLYSNCLAAIYIPVDEDEGYVPIEAGASEKTTIGVNEGGLKETIIDGETGFLIDDITPQKVAEKIDFLATNRSVAREMGEKANRYTQRFDWESTLSVLDKAIENFLERGKQR